MIRSLAGLEKLTVVGVFLTYFLEKWILGVASEVCPFMSMMNINQRISWAPRYQLYQSADEVQYVFLHDVSQSSGEDSVSEYT